jgi:hypothetical protein
MFSSGKIFMNNSSSHNWEDMLGYSDFGWAASNNLIFESMRFAGSVVVPLGTDSLTLFYDAHLLFVVLKFWEDFGLITFERYAILMKRVYLRVPFGLLLFSHLDWIPN